MAKIFAKGHIVNIFESISLYISELNLESNLESKALSLSFCLYYDLIWIFVGLLSGEIFVGVGGCQPPIQSHLTPLHAGACT